ncbi:hypothetical protein CONLIGDRAFT_2012 [Coniochaeta ligniaria NRRL 30616]|uniref:Uncharacterized protein n=1 Tax=Coniochaeta ligniaria NRRL 30616 TaxID=1408157 RepID=A0A1J7JWC1_9PEZI|nr:hypothetical protein CONLIGDRAFT_2012 [Coniochaeta ligniaria NRRL 30616]
MLGPMDSEGAVCGYLFRTSFLLWSRLSLRCDEKSAGLRQKSWRKLEQTTSDLLDKDTMGEKTPLCCNYECIRLHDCTSLPFCCSCCVIRLHQSFDGTLRGPMHAERVAFSPPSTTSICLPARFARRSPVQAHCRLPELMHNGASGPFNTVLRRSGAANVIHIVHDSHLDIYRLQLPWPDAQLRPAR